MYPVMASFFAHSVAEHQPSGLIRIKISAVKNYRLQQSCKGVGESAASVVSEDMSMLMDEDGECLSEFGLKHLGGKEHFPGRIVAMITQFSKEDLALRNGVGRFAGIKNGHDLWSEFSQRLTQHFNAVCFR